MQHLVNTGPAAPAHPHAVIWTRSSRPTWTWTWTWTWTASSLGRSSRRPHEAPWSALHVSSKAVTKYPVCPDCHVPVRSTTPAAPSDLGRVGGVGPLSSKRNERRRLLFHTLNQHVQAKWPSTNKSPLLSRSPTHRHATSSTQISTDKSPLLLPHPLPAPSLTCAGPCGACRTHAPAAGRWPARAPPTPRASSPASCAPCRRCGRGGSPAAP